MALGKRVALAAANHEAGRAWRSFGPHDRARFPTLRRAIPRLGMALVYSGQGGRGARSRSQRQWRLDPHYAPIVLHFLAQGEFQPRSLRPPRPGYFLSASHATPAPTRAECCWLSCYGHLGRAEDARITWAELLKVNPDFSLSQRGARVACRTRIPVIFSASLKAWPKAGLP